MLFTIGHDASDARANDAFNLSQCIWACVALLILEWSFTLHYEHLLLGEAFFCTARTAFPVKNLVTSAYVAVTSFSSNAAIGRSLYCETAVPAASSCRSFVKGSFPTMRTGIKIRHKNHLLSFRCSIRTV